MFGAKMSLM